MKTKELLLFAAIKRAHRKKEAPVLSESVRESVMKNLRSQQSEQTESVDFSLSADTREQVLSRIWAMAEQSNGDQPVSIFERLKGAQRERGLDVSLSEVQRDQVLRAVRLIAADVEEEVHPFWALLWPVARVLTPITCALFVYAISVDSVVTRDLLDNRPILSEVLF